MGIVRTNLPRFSATLCCVAASVVLWPAAAAGADGSQVTWVAYRPGSQQTQRVDQELVVPQEFACPQGTTAYPGTLARFDCLTTYRDNGNNGPDPTIGLRRGEPIDGPSFGLQKIQYKHGLTQRSIGYVVVNNREGIEQPNGNLKYGLFQAVNGIPDGVAIEVIVQQAPSNEDVRPDNYNLGVVTAYCVGFDGKCPPGVNESIAPGQP